MIVSWSGGLASRLIAAGLPRPRKTAETVRRDFSAFALSYIRDPRVGPDARAAFAEVFLTSRVVTYDGSDTPPPTVRPWAEKVVPVEAAEESAEEAKACRGKRKRKPKRSIR